MRSLLPSGSDDPVVASSHLGAAAEPVLTDSYVLLHFPEVVVQFSKGFGECCSETPWFCRRLGLLDFGQGLVGPLGIVERGFELGGWNVLEVAVEALVLCQ